MIFNINSTRGQTWFLTFVARVTCLVFITFPYCSTTSLKRLGVLTFDGEGYKLELRLLVYCVTGGGDSVYCVTGGGDSGPGDGHIQPNCQSATVSSWLSHLQEVRRSSQDQTGSYAQGKHSPCIVSHVESCIRKSFVGSNIHIEVNRFNSLWVVFESVNDVSASHQQAFVLAQRNSPGSRIWW